MGYVACLCCACAGPIGHGYGLDGALEATEETHGKGTWKLPLPKMKWLEKMRVVSADAAEPSPVLEYEDYGMVDGPNDTCWSLNPFGWTDMEEDESSPPGIAFHSDCLKVMTDRLAAADLDLPSFFVAYHQAVLTGWDRYKSDEESQEMSIFMDCLLPSIDYGPALSLRDQFYEFNPGNEWLVCSPATSSVSEGGTSGEQGQGELEWSQRNRERIEKTVEQLISDIVVPHRQ